MPPTRVESLDHPLRLPAQEPVLVNIVSFPAIKEDVVIAIDIVRRLEGGRFCTIGMEAGPLPPPSTSQ